MAKISLTPSWLHKWSAFLVTGVSSMAVWHWNDVVDPQTAGAIVFGLGAAKMILEFLSPDVPKDGPAA